MRSLWKPVPGVAVSCVLLFLFFCVLAGLSTTNLELPNRDADDGTKNRLKRDVTNNTAILSSSDRINLTGRSNGHFNGSLEAAETGRVSGTVRNTVIIPNRPPGIPLGQVPPPNTQSPPPNNNLPAPPHPINQIPNPRPPTVGDHVSDPGMPPNNIPPRPINQVPNPGGNPLQPPGKPNGPEMLGDYLSDSFGPAQPQWRYVRPDYMDQQKIDHLLLLHNKVRSSVTPPADQMLKMSWDYDLEAHAWEHTQRCQFTPSFTGERVIPNFHRVGENLWVGWGVPFEAFNPENVISTWVKEKKYFDASLRSCIGGACERYVQMVWSMSYKLGCAWSQCDNMDVHGFPITGATFVACHYAPGSNNAPFIPYYHGITCSFCDSVDFCEYNLCANPARDVTTGADPFPTEPPTTTPLTTTTKPLSEEAKIALIVVGSLAGCTLLLTVTIHIGVRLARRRAEGQLSDYFKDIPRRLSLWYDNRRHSQHPFNNVEDGEHLELKSKSSAVTSHSKASIEYHANLWNE